MASNERLTQLEDAKTRLQRLLSRECKAEIRARRPNTRKVHCDNGRAICEALVLLDDAIDAKKSKARR